MSPAAATPNGRKGWLDRALSLFTEVRGGESVSALLLVLNIFVLNVFITAQFWAFANDIYTEEQGKRLFPK